MLTKEIPLTKGMVALIDADDYERLSIYKWHYSGRYARRTRRKNHVLRCIMMHHEIINIPDGYECDHINGNTLDNRKENLRIATHGQNGHNRPVREGTISGYKGVCWHKTTKKWRAKINVNKTTYNLGYFNDKIEAAKAYDVAARKLLGSFAKCNFLQ